MTTVAVLITCFNRRETTLTALNRLASQELPHGIRIEVFLTDDGSTDSTGDAVRSAHPLVHILPGDGSLYWTGGMLLAEEAALKASPDYLLWLNDDVDLEADAIEGLLRVSAGRAVAVGAVADPSTRTASYGGHRRHSASRLFPLEKVEPTGRIESLDTMNGNVVLVPTAVRLSVGPLDRKLRHNMADFDYGLRCRAAGVPVLLSPRFAGTCPPNASKASWADGSKSLAVRWRTIMSIKGLPPKQWLRFTRRHCGRMWPRYFVGPYVRMSIAGLGRHRRDRPV